MNDIIYLEPDAEITSVIDKIRKSQNDAVVLVIPRGGTLAQSIINLKLLIRSAREHNKGIALVSSDKITANLSNQLEIKIFSKVSDAEKAQIRPIEEIKRPEIVEDEPVPNLKANTYKKYSLANLNSKALENQEEEEVPEEEAAEPEEDEPTFRKRPVGQQVQEYLDKDDKPRQGITGQNYDENEALPIEAEEDEVDDQIRVSPDSQELRLSRKHIKTEGSRKPFLMVAIIVLLILSVSAAFIFAPKAKALVVLKTRDADEKLNILVSRDAKPQDGVLAVSGQIIDLEKESTKTYPASGKKNVGEKAKGTVTITNQYSYQNPIKIAKGTKIISDNKSFILQADVTVPIAKASAVIENNLPVLKTTPGTVDGEVVAEQSGEIYNLAAGKTLYIASYADKKDKVYAQSKSAFSGGTDKEVNVVTDKDLSDAETALKAEMLEAAKPELTDEAGKGSFRILESNISADVISQSSNKNADDEADNFDFKMKIKFFVIGFKESDVKKAVLEGIKQKAKSDEMIVNPDESEITYKIVDSDIDNAQMNLEASFKGKIGKSLSADVIKKSLKNKSLSGAENYLRSLDGVDSASVIIWPTFWQRTPFSADRIEVKFDYNK